MELTTKQLKDLWKSQSSKRDEMISNKQYYDGENTFLNSTTTADGSNKSNVLYNYINYIVDFHSSAIISNGIEYVSEEDLTDFYNILHKNDVNTIDMENMKSALITGSSIELINVGLDNNIKITQFDPESFTILKDGKDIVLGIYQYIIPAMSMHNGIYYSEKTTQYIVFDDQNITTYRESDKGEWYIHEITKHIYGICPLVEYNVYEDGRSFLSNSIKDQTDAYNRIINARLDEIEFNVDGFMILRGFDSEAEDLDRKITTMRTNRAAILSDPTANLELLQKNNDTAKYNDSINISRRSILDQANVPDIQDIVGLTGNSSGIALRLKFLPAMNKAAGFFSYFKRGLSKRVEIINKLSMLKNKQSWDISDTKYIYYMPIDIIAQRASMKDLVGITSEYTLLENHPDVKDVNVELERIDKEKDSSTTLLSE